jgi:urease accessory protein
MLAAAAAGAVAPLLVAGRAGAHTGLPTRGAPDGLTHPLLGLDHFLAMVAVGVLAAVGARGRVIWLIPGSFVAGMIAGGALGFAGVETSLGEAVIAMSVVVLGALIVFRAGNTGLWCPMLAATFGAAHGHAHGMELPAGAAPLSYMVGFVVATALHLAGTAIGVALRRAPTLRVASGALVSIAGLLLVTTP